MKTNEKILADKIQQSFSKLTEVFRENEKSLCSLDAMAGDGDHGITILRGISAAQAELESKHPNTLSDIFKTIGYAMLESMGGASGPIFSTLFIQAAICTKDIANLDGQDVLRILEETYNALHELTEAKAGEKTMLDSIWGAREYLSEKITPEMTWGEAFTEAATGAAIGAEKTVDMIATKGRAKYLKEKSIGFCDAGAKSCALILENLANIFN